MSSWICLASGKIALRVRMEIDLLAQRFDFPLRRRKTLTNARGRRAPNHIMDCEHRSRLQAVVKSFVEYRIQGMQLVECQILKLATFFQTEFHRLTHLLVRPSR